VCLIDHSASPVEHAASVARRGAERERDLDSDSALGQQRAVPTGQRAGLAPLTPHNLRDTAASLAVQSGANVKAVQRMLGHASASMTLDVYSGLFDAELDDVAERMNDAATEALGEWGRGGEQVDDGGDG